MQVQEKDLMKALGDMEAVLQKGANVKNMKNGKVPEDTDEANGGMDGGGDLGKLDVNSKKSLAEWAAEADDEDDFDDEVGDEEDDDEIDKAMDDDDEDSEEESDEEDSDDDDDEETSKKSNRRPSLAKSMGDVMANAYDGDAFLETLIDQVSDSDLELRKSISDLGKRQKDATSMFAKALTLNTRMVLELKKSLDELSGTPVSQRRSVLSKGDINERFDEQPTQYTRDQVLDAMSGLAQQNKIPTLAVSTYEVSGQMLNGDVRKAVEAELQKGAA